MRTGSANPADPPAGLLATETDPLGHVTSYQYNARELVTQITYAVGTADEAHVHVEYDAAWRIWAQVDELGRRTEYDYDSSNRVTTVTQPDPDGPSGPLSAPVTSYQYNDLGQLVSETDPLNRVTSYTYEGSRLTSVARPDHDGNGQLTVTTMAYTSAGLLASITDPLGRATGYGYDSQSRRTSVTLPDPDGAGEQSAPVTQYAYDALGRVISTSDAQNNVTSYVYSNHGRTVTVTEPDPDGAGALSAPVTVLQYDSAGNLLSQTDALGRETSYGYDSLGRQETITEPDPDGAGPLTASVTTYGYDKAGNLVSVTDSLNQVTEYVYDARNRRTQIIDAEEGVTQFEYDAVGNLVSLTDPVGNTTTWQYDGLNRVIAETNELDFTRTFRYDAAGRQIERVDRLGRVIVYAYDTLDNLTTETWYANQADADAQTNPVNVIHYTHDAAGRLLSEWDTYSSSTYTYDALDRVLSETIANPGSPTVVLTTGYANSPLLPAGEGQGVRALRTSLSATIAGVADFLRTFEYDSRGQLTGITQTGQTGGNVVANLQIDLAYDSLGRFASITRYQDSHLVAASTWQYDAAYHLTALTHAQGATTLAGYAWTYDSAGRLTQMTSPDGTVVYSYDSTSQLTGADYSGGQDDETFDWDANGNPTGTGYLVGPNNQLLSDGTYRYEYDAEGNRSAKYVWTDADSDGIVDPGERSQITEYSWDHRNRLTGITERASEGGDLTKAVDYLYDTHNRWIGREVDRDGAGTESSETTRFIYDGNQILLQFGDSGQLTNRYAYGPAVDQILADEQVTSASSPGEVVWPLPDHLNTVRDLAVYDSQEDETTVANHRVYDSFGQVISETNAAVDHLFAFTGRPLDEAMGLQIHGNRLDEPRTGRWASEDPLGCVAGDANLGRFVHNSVCNFTDPSGLMPNRIGAITLEDFLRGVRRIERLYPNETPAQHLVRVRDTLKGGRWFLSGGANSATSSGGSPPNDPEAHVIGWAYIYTENGGWIDLAHFMEAARYTQIVSGPVTTVGGVFVELYQTVGVVFWPLEGVGSSAFSKEDIPSNNYGAYFGQWLTNSQPLSSQLGQFFGQLGATDPTRAPDWQQLPSSEQEWEKKFRSGREFHPPQSRYFMPCKCFAAGTPVLCPDGARAIECIREGDRVLAYDLEQRQVVESRVLRADAFHGDFNVLEMRISDENRVYVTDHHAFYNGSKWVTPGDIGAGELVMDASGRRSPVFTTSATRRRVVTTYNFRTQHGTYLVGATGLVAADRTVQIGGASRTGGVSQTSRRILVSTRSLTRSD